MSLRNLIRGETIDIDNHNRGVNLDIDDKAIHLHKRFNKGCKRFAKSEATFDLNRDNRNITVVKRKGPKADTIIREIQKAFEDDNLRHDFVNDLIDSLQDLAKFAQNHQYYSVKRGTDERRLTQAGADRILQIITRVYDYFKGPNDELKSFHYDPAAGFIVHFVALPTKPGIAAKTFRAKMLCCDKQTPNGRNFYVLADVHHISISLSSSRKDLLDRSNAAEQ